MTPTPEKSREELLPCPFCGGPAQILLEGDELVACCASPGSKCPMDAATINAGSEEQATKRWNTRAPNTPALAMIRRLLAKCHCGGTGKLATVQPYWPAQDCADPDCLAARKLLADAGVES